MARKRPIKTRPVIGVTGPSGAFVPSWWFISWAVRRAGGQPLRMTPDTPHTDKALAGVIISGGEDIAPDIYSDIFHDNVTPRDNARDAFELRVLEQALARHLPILGICRGAQLINVALRGNLHQDLRTIRRRTSNRRSLLPCKTVAIRPWSHLSRITRLRRARVNSLHHQSVARVGGGVIVCAVDADGIIQAIEASDNDWLLGVQWHPEYLPYLASQRRIFTALVTACLRRTC